MNQKKSSTIISFITIFCLISTAIIISNVSAESSPETSEKNSENNNLNNPKPMNEMNDTNKFTYNRKEREPETGFYYFGARHYDPNPGARFTTVDPFIGNPTDPRTFNRYAYCLNNPLNNIDPTGKTVIQGPIFSEAYYFARTDIETFSVYKRLHEETDVYIIFESPDYKKVSKKGIDGIPIALESFSTWKDGELCAILIETYWRNIGKQRPRAPIFQYTLLRELKKAEIQIFGTEAEKNFFSQKIEVNGYTASGGDLLSIVNTFEDILCEDEPITPIHLRDYPKMMNHIDNLYGEYNLLSRNAKNQITNKEHLRLIDSSDLKIDNYYQQFFDIYEESHNVKRGMYGPWQHPHFNLF